MTQRNVAIGNTVADGLLHEQADLGYRLIHCLLNGLPLDIDVYDSATWSVLVELSERSVLHGGSAVEVPDFTRGARQTAQPLEIVGC